jgi:hypothetical protein
MLHARYGPIVRISFVETGGIMSRMLEYQKMRVVARPFQLKFAHGSSRTSLSSDKKKIR